MYHVPIMRDRITQLLQVERGGLYLDATLGGGGHSQAILDAGGRVVAIDRDDDAIEYCKAHVTGDITYIKGQYENAATLLEGVGVTKISGAVMDCGVSSHQLDAPDRGFSYMHDGALDMRMDRRQKFSAYDVINGYSEEQLTDIIRRYGEESFARRIAGAIVKRRAQQPIERTVELAELIRASVPYRKNGQSCAHRSQRRAKRAVRRDLRHFRADRARRTVRGAVIPLAGRPHCKSRVQGVCNRLYMSEAYSCMRVQPPRDGQDGVQRETVRTGTDLKPTQRQRDVASNRKTLRKV